MCDRLTTNRKRSGLLWLVSLLAAQLSVGTVTVATAQHVTRTPADVARELSGATTADSRRVTLAWENVSLSDALARLARAASVDVFLDRRVDPSRRVDLRMRSADADAVLAQLASANALGYTTVGTLYYVGPPDTCGKLRTLIAVRMDETARLPEPTQQAWQRVSDATWPRLAAPREVVQQLVDEAGLTLVNPAQIPHDFWPAGRLPELSLAARLSVLLAGFELTFSLDDGGRRLTIVPIEQHLKLRASYHVVAQQHGDLTGIRERLSDARLTLDGDKVTLEGQWEEHLELQRLLGESARVRARRSARRTETRDLFTLRVAEQPVRTLVEQLAHQLALELSWDEPAIAAAGRSLDQRVSLTVEEVDLNGLLDAALRPAGLTFRRTESRVEVIPARGAPQ